MESIPYNSRKRNHLGTNLSNSSSRFELVKSGIKMIYSGISGVSLQIKVDQSSEAIPGTTYYNPTSGTLSVTEVRKRF